MEGMVEMFRHLCAFENQETKLDHVSLMAMSSHERQELWFTNMYERVFEQDDSGNGTPVDLCSMPHTGRWPHVENPKLNRDLLGIARNREHVWTLLGSESGTSEH